MKAQQIWQGLSPREWTAPERRAVGLIRGGRVLEEAAAEAKADVERVRAAWAIHSATPEGKAHAKANERVRVLGAEERARVEAELKAREGAPALRAEVEQLRQRLAQAEGLAAIEQQGREAAEAQTAHEARRAEEAMGRISQIAAQRDEASSAAFAEGLGRAKAERERDEARAEIGRFRSSVAELEAELGAARKARADTDREMRFRVEANQAHERADAADDEVRRLTSEAEVLRGLLDDQRKLREQTEERLRVEEQQAMKAEARADAAEAEVQRLAAQVRGIKELVAAVARIEAALAEGVKTQPSKLAAAVAQESAEEVAQLRAELAARTKGRDASRAAMADLLRERQTSTPPAPRSSACSTKGCGAPSRCRGLCMRCYKREWSARKAAGR